MPFREVGVDLVMTGGKRRAGCSSMGDNYGLFGKVRQSVLEDREHLVIRSLFSHIVEKKRA
jgi:hypothetical protein